MKTTFTNYSECKYTASKEVFEKIIDELKIERTTANKTFVKYEMNVDLGRVFGLEKAIEIVKQEAEQCNNGWIPCSVRLPEEYTVLCCDKYGEMIIGHPYFDEVSDTNYSAESDNEMMYNCVAWQPLPQPYQQKGE